MEATGNLALWSNNFLAFLRDSQYDGPDTKMKTHNLNNIYNLLFVPGQPLQGSPAPDVVLQHMLEHGLLEQDGDFLKVSPNN